MAKNRVPGDQPSLPGADDVMNKRVHAAAIRLSHERSLRLAANRLEKDAETNLVRIMHEEGMTSYKYKDVEVHLDVKEKAKVKTAGADDGDE